MTNALFSLRARDLARLRLPRSARQLRTARGFTVEQTARLAPDWGVVEAPSAPADSPWNVRRF